ncbi:MAG TPA: hypothetical protein VFS45_02385 [Sphingomicrobium sp.]|nr:hypothetical protein [Sphingomicrobium sp.]
MRNGFSAAALAVATVMSSAALSAPRDYSQVGIEQPGAWFNCVSPYPGPGGFRTGPCWLDFVGRNAG